MGRKEGKEKEGRKKKIGRKGGRKKEKTKLIKKKDKLNVYKSESRKTNINGRERGRKWVIYRFKWKGIGKFV